MIAVGHFVFANERMLTSSSAVYVRLTALSVPHLWHGMLIVVTLLAAAAREQVRCTLVLTNASIDEEELDLVFSVQDAPNTGAELVRMDSFTLA